MGFVKIKNIYRKQWKEQESLEGSLVTKRAFDYYITKNLKRIKEFLKEGNTDTLHLCDNVYILNSKADGITETLAIHVDKDTFEKESDKDAPYNKSIWFPQPSTLECDDIEEIFTYEVFPVKKEWIKDKKVCYKSLSTKDDKWKYLNFHDTLGLRFSGEESDCTANYQMFDFRKIKSVDANMLIENFPEGSLIVIEETKSNIKNKNTSKLINWLDAFLKVNKAKTYEVVFVFSGYEEIIGAPYEDKDIREFVNRLIEERPEILWFAENKADIILPHCAVLDENGQVMIENNKYGFDIAVDDKKIEDLKLRVKNALMANKYFNQEDINKFMDIMESRPQEAS